MSFKFTYFLIVIFTAVFADLSAANLDADSLSNSRLFDSEEILEISMRGDLRKPLADKTQNPKFYPIELAYQAEDKIEKSLSVEIKARGNFRRLLGNCSYAPLMLKFGKDEITQNSLFSGQKELKLVMPCQGDEYVIREWMAYKIYNLLTPLSFKVRLVKITLQQEGKSKVGDAFYGFLLEDEKQLAARNGLVPLKRNLDPRQTQTADFQRMAVFEYLIGNTDWSVQFRQNIKLINEGGAQLPFAVPYDFDHSGIVNAPYAEPAASLKMNTVRQRRYRGFCVENLDDFVPTIQEFLAAKDAIYGLYQNSTLLEKDYQRATLSYLDDFYRVIQDEAAWRKDFGYPCDPNGTGNVVIKGLKEN